MRRQSSLGFLGCAVLVAFARSEVVVVVPVYLISPVLAYAVTRGSNPIEVYGRIVSKLAETALASWSRMVMGLSVFRA